MAKDTRDSREVEERKIIGAPQPRQQPPIHKEDELLSLSEVARRLGVSPPTVASWIKSGLLKAHKLPSDLYRVRASEVNKLLSNSALAGRKV